jgi:presequence protease
MKIFNFLTMKTLTVLKKLTFIILFLMIALISNSCRRSESYPGYKLIEKRFIKEVNAQCYLLEHIKSGARVLKIAADDQNKTFCIAFKTIPESDGGTPHIIEHSVLNGSINFPVKSPFDVMMKGSLNTFLNAFTSNDFTAYPVASMNEKDYFNLMHVYLDAVFNPLIYNDQRIFMQEGWHYELTSPKAPLELRGVVYNEMKGACSDPESELYYQINKSLFTESCYKYSAGGYPSEIPNLTYQSFLNFHKKYYHPSNSYIFLYGDAALSKELAFIDSNYLSKYEKEDIPAEIRKDKPFISEKDSKGYYSVIDGAATEKQTFLSINWVIGSGDDDLTSMTLDVLADVLVNQESAPIRIALKEAGIGKEVNAIAQRLLQNVFTIEVKNANQSDKEKFRQVIFETLAKVCSDRIDKEALKGTLNRTEFRLREGDDAQKGLMYSFRCANNWLYSGNPFPSLEYDTYLDKLKKSIEGSFLEDFIKKNLLENNFRALVTLEPKPGLENENMKKITEQLSDFKKSLSATKIDSILNVTKKLIEFQKAEDSPEALAKIPLLKLSDINPKAAWYDCKVNETSGIIQLFHNEFTNKIVYTTQWFDLRVLPQELIPYAGIVSELLGKLGAGKYDFKQLDKALNNNTGEFSSYVGVRLPGNDDGKIIPLLIVKMKTTVDKIDTALTLIGEIINNTNFSDKGRLKELLSRNQANLEASLNQDGYSASIKRFDSYLSKRGMILEMTSNLDYYRFMNDLLKQFNQDPEAMISNLQKVAKLIFTRNTLSAGVTCSETDYSKYNSSFKSFVTALPEIKPQILGWHLEPEAKNEGIMTSSKVQYVLKGFDYKKLGLEWDGKWNVLKQILSTDWLQTQIRVVGGAYGGFSIINDYGSVIFASYRDPNLSETLKRFDNTVNYLSNFQADSTQMSRFIIGTIAGLDYLTTPSQRGDLSFRNYFMNKTMSSIQKERDAVLSTTPQDIRDMSKFISEILKQDVVCVYGNDVTIKANKDLFKGLVTLEK